MGVEALLSLVKVHSCSSGGSESASTVLHVCPVLQRYFKKSESSVLCYIGLIILIYKYSDTNFDSCSSNMIKVAKVH